MPCDGWLELITFHWLLQALWAAVVSGVRMMAVIPSSLKPLVDTVI